jgi:hypothetical protein
MDAGTCAVAVCMTNVVVVAASNSFIMCAVSPVVMSRLVLPFLPAMRVYFGVGKRTGR